jgi:hypothetical protein
MEVNELRKTNLIQDEKNNIFMVDGIDCFNCKILTTSIYEWFNEGLFEPIPLTEEWLLRFGFEDKGKKVFRIVNSGMNMSFSVAFTGIGYTPCQFSSKRIEYVHQLQNLYFALTGEELAIA